MRYTTILCALPVATLLFACAPQEPPVTNQELRAEIERLENEIGRLEFRIFQLESAVSSGGVAVPDDSAGDQQGDADSARPASEPAPQGDGRFDLTPVEP